MKQANPGSRKLLFGWIAIEIAVFGYIGWAVANAKTTNWAVQPKTRIPPPRSRR